MAGRPTVHPFANWLRFDNSAPLGVRSKLGRGGVQELRTHGARTQDQLGFGYRSRLKTIIWLAVLLRNPSSQLVRFVDKRRVYEHFGTKGHDAENLRGSALFPTSCADRYSASHCGDLRRFACLTPWSSPAEFT
jgi:hypothetical protein